VAPSGLFVDLGTRYIRHGRASQRAAELLLTNARVEVDALAVLKRLNLTQ